MPGMRGGGGGGRGMGGGRGPGGAGADAKPSLMRLAAPADGGVNVEACARQVSQSLRMLTNAAIQAANRIKQVQTVATATALDTKLVELGAEASELRTHYAAIVALVTALDPNAAAGLPTLE